MKKTTIGLLLIAAFGLCACDSATLGGSSKIADAKDLLNIGDFRKLEQAADTFSDGADECLLDVRDRGLKYETSRNCAVLWALSLAYLKAGGQTMDEPSRIRDKGNSARAVAWSARASSALGGGTQNLW